MGRPGLEQPNHAQPQGYRNNQGPVQTNKPMVAPVNNQTQGYRNNQGPVQTNRPMGTPVNNQTQNLWSSDLFDCMNDSENAVITCIAPCVTFGQIAEIVDEGVTPCATSGLLYGVIFVFGLSFVYSSMFRAKMRNKFGLPDAPAPDWLTHLFCEPCALCQEYRELKHRGLDPNIGWIGNVQAQKQQEMMAPPTGQRMMG